MAAVCAKGQAVHDSAVSRFVDLELQSRAKGIGGGVEGYLIPWLNHVRRVVLLPFAVPILPRQCCNPELSPENGKKTERFPWCVMLLFGGCPLCVLSALGMKSWILSFRIPLGHRCMIIVRNTSTKCCLEFDAGVCLWGVCVYLRKSE